MALKHVRAVQSQAITTEPMGRAILTTIAIDIGHRGQPSFPSYRTIADRVGCHYNTVSSWVKQLEESGDLVITKDGKRQKYSIPFVIEDEELSQPDYDSSYDKHCDSDYDNLKEIVTTLSQRVELLSQRVELLSQSTPNIVTTQTMTEEEVFIEDYRSKEDIYISPDPEPLADIKTEIGIVVKTRPFGKAEEVYDKFAHALFDSGITREQVKGFSSWWERNRHYPGKPALKSMIDEWSNYIDGIETKPKQSPNGHNNGHVETAAQKVARILGDQTV